MSAGEHDLYIEQGADFYMLITLEDNTGARIDLTGHTFTGKIRTVASATPVIETFDFTVLNQAVPATKGQVEMRLTAADSSAIAMDASSEPKRTSTFFTYDVESVVASIVTRWLQGIIEMSPEVTR